MNRRAPAGAGPRRPADCRSTATVSSANGELLYASQPGEDNRPLLERMAR